MELDEQRFDAAAAAYDSAAELLGERPWDNDDATVAHWLEVMVVGRAQLHLHRNEPELALAVLDAARPVLEARGCRSPQAPLLPAPWLAAGDRAPVAGRRKHRRRCRAGPWPRPAPAVTDSNWYREKGPATAWAALFLGFFLMLHDEQQEAEEQLQTSLGMAERSGDVILTSSSLFCLTIAARPPSRHPGPSARWPLGRWRQARSPAGPFS